jgi:hypothetical protein
MAPAPLDGVRRHTRASRAARSSPRWRATRANRMLSSVMRGLSERARRQQTPPRGRRKGRNGDAPRTPQRPKAALLPCANRGSATSRSRRCRRRLNTHPRAPVENAPPRRLAHRCPGGDGVWSFAAAGEPGGGPWSTWSSGRRSGACASSAAFRSRRSPGEGVPDTVTEHPAVFVTLSAPSFGPVHTRPLGPDGQPRRCRPRRDAPVCEHGMRLSCAHVHADDDPAWASRSVRTATTTRRP